MSIERVYPVFSVAFAVAYLVAVEQNWPLFTYHAQTGAVGLFLEPPKTGPAMYWYGWLATATAAGAFTAGLAMAIPEKLSAGVNQRWTWVIPLLAIVTFAVLLRSFFLR